MIIEFFIPIEPVAWERARSCGKRFFTAPKSDQYKKEIRFMLERKKFDFTFLYDKPLAITMTFHLPRPLKLKRSFPCVRPDIDNYAKSVLDAMNEICFKDDGQVVYLSLMKVYKKDVTGTNVSIKIMEEL